VRTLFDDSRCQGYQINHLDVSAITMLQVQSSCTEYLIVPVQKGAPKAHLLVMFFDLSEDNLCSKLPDLSEDNLCSKLPDLSEDNLCSKLPDLSEDNLCSKLPDLS
jgi:hypothetical protein